jgi:monoamine oxidase
MHNRSMPTDLVIVGAGVAGLSAAARLRAAGFSTLIVEATERIGGRAWTQHGGALGDAAFDRGASWLHAAERNPLTAIAESHGDVLRDSENGRTRHVMTDGRLATEAERAAYAANWERFEEVASAHAVEGAWDISLSDAIAGLRDDPWTATVEYWEASLIAAADSRRLSVRDWHRNLLEGTNLQVAGGIGAFVARRLGPDAGEIWRRTPATRIDWDGPGGRVAVETPRGTIQARACIVTVSTGVLASGAIEFAPMLPAATREAISGLPMGLLTKVALRAAGSDRLGLPPSCSIQQRLERPHAPAISLYAWPEGHDHIIGFIGGTLAWELSEAGGAAAEDFAMGRLTALFGARAAHAVRPVATADWGQDPAFLGAYAYALPGHAESRAMLGAPVGDGRLIFAGEAVRTDGLAGTVGGAWLSGRDAAEAVAQAVGAGVA